MRCPQCGNDIQRNQFVCVVCGTQLIVESIERRIPYFKRHEERWRKPMKMMERFKLVLLNPSKAIWDITHRPSGQAFGFLFFINALLFGLVGVVILAKIDISSVIGIGGKLMSDLPGYHALFYLGAYAVFFVIGMIYLLILWLFIVIAHTYGAKLGLNIVTRGKKQAGVIYWMFLPSLFATGLYVGILAIGLPPVKASGSLLGVSPAIIAAVEELFANGKDAFMAADIAQVVVYFGYMSILMSFVFRELYDKSTQRALVTSIITGLICMGVFIMTRSSLAIGIF
ncbi:MAG: TFIIB-type zinc ribbon-containing protein [Candidatus Hodarchaeota archaeon]